MNNIFMELKEKIEKIDFSGLILYNENKDGRLNSAIAEGQVFDFLKQHIPELEEAPTRHWYDCMYKGYPFNIKITSGTSADNLNSKMGLLYAMTGCTPEEIRAKGYGNIEHWINFNQALKELTRINPCDYGFIVVFKEKHNNVSNVFLTSLKRLDKLVSNGNNLPFQANWSQNKIWTSRSEWEQMKYIKEVYIDSWMKKTSGIMPLLEWKENGI